MSKIIHFPAQDQSIAIGDRIRVTINDWDAGEAQIVATVVGLPSPALVKVRHNGFTQTFQRSDCQRIERKVA